MTENDITTLENLNLSKGIVCDVETGICGPADEIEQNKEEAKESNNENNDLV